MFYEYFCTYQKDALLPQSPGPHADPQAVPDVAVVGVPLRVVAVAGPLHKRR